MDDFIPLAKLLRGAQAAPVGAVQALADAAATPSAPLPNAAVPNESARGTVRNVVDFAHADLLHEVALMRLAAVESFEHAKNTLLATLAQEVLARELVLAPVDVEALAARVLASFADLEPVTIAVSPSDAERVAATVPMRIDSALAAGDLILDVRAGTIESRFAFRLQSALDRAAASGAA